MPRMSLLAFWAVLAVPPAAAAQTWNSDSALALVRRAIARRSEAMRDTALRDYKAQAHGFLFFLGQFGEGLREPPRLIKADQLELEVYWKAPGLSKQRIVGWRDRAELPTDIVYHRDHLGIFQNNFGATIRVGEGDEVRDVPHPLAADGPALYEYAFDDTTTLALPQRVVRVVALQVRPKDFTQPRVVGTLYLDAESADLVRLAITFTPRAYLDSELEDLNIVLDNALWEGRFWLPYRQEVEIRRRTAWLDVPARSIIRGRWQVDGYVFNIGLATSWFQGDEITALSKAERDSFPWRQSFDSALEGAAAPVRRSDLAAVRADLERVAGARALSGLQARRWGARRLSDLVHVNRVEGLALGAGVVARSGDTRALRVLASYGFADHRPKGEVAGVVPEGGGALGVDVFRALRDVGDVPVIAPILNSFSAQEFGADYGDYYVATGAGLSYRHGLGARGEWSAALRRETIDSATVHARPAAGTYRANPALPPVSGEVVELGLRRRGEGLAVRRDLEAEFVVEGGALDGGATYARVAGGGHVLFPLGLTHGLVGVQAGAATTDLPAYRAFVLGGRGTLLGDDFRRFGGRRMALVHGEWRVPVPFVSLAVGPYTRTPRSAIVAPFVAVGWADRPVVGTPWTPTSGARTTLGLAIEWLGLLRLEAGVGMQSHALSFAFDVTQDFWDVL